MHLACTAFGEDDLTGSSLGANAGAEHILHRLACYMDCGPCMKFCRHEDDKQGIMVEAQKEAAAQSREAAAAAARAEAQRLSQHQMQLDIQQRVVQQHQQLTQLQEHNQVLPPSLPPFLLSDSSAYLSAERMMRHESKDKSLAKGLKLTQVERSLLRRL